MTEPSDKLAALALGLSDEAHYMKHWSVAELMTAAEILVIKMHDDAVRDLELARENSREERVAGTEARDLALFRSELSALRRRIPLGVS